MKKNILLFLLIFIINILLFSVNIVRTNINFSVNLKTPVTQNFKIFFDNSYQEVVLNSEVLIDFSVPFNTSNIKIDSLDNADISDIYVGNNKINKFEKVQNALILYKSKMICKILFFAFFATVIEFLLIGLMFLKNDNIIIKDMLNNKKLYYLSWGILCCIIVWNFYNICINAVNIPFFDEWEALLPGHLDKNLNLNWIFGFHNEHKIVFTKLSTWIFYHLDGWNLRHQIIFNFFINLSAMFMLYKILPDKHNLLPLFFAPCFSVLVGDNQLTGFQSCFYYMLLFTFIAIYFGFVKIDNIKNCILFSLFSVFSMFSMTFITGIGLLAAYWIKEKAVNRFTVLSTIITAGGMAGFLSGYGSVMTNEEILYPYQLAFWNKYFYLLFKGILNLSLPVYLLLICGIGFIAFLIYSYLKNRADKQFNIYTAVFGVSMLLAAAIACARNTDALSADGRHLYVVVVLIPCIAALLYRLKLYKVELIYLVILLYTFSSSFSYSSYVARTNYKLTAKRQLENVIATDYNCDYSVLAYIVHYDVKSALKRAEELELSFMRGK